MKSGWQKLKERREKEERARRGRQLVTQFFSKKEGISPIEPQKAEFGPEVKSGRAYGGPYGAQPVGLGYEEKPQVRYGIGGLLFSGSSMGHHSIPYRKYGNPYGLKANGNYNPLEFSANPTSSAKYRMGGSPYTASASHAKAPGKYGSYGGQQLGLPAGTGNSGKYGNPFLSYEALGPVTDGQSIDQLALQYEAPAIDRGKSADQFGPASYIKGGVQAEVSLGNPAYLPVDMPTEEVTPEHISVQQNFKGPQLPQAMSWTGGKELKHNLKGFFGNGYHG